MEICIVGLEGVGKTTLVNIMAVSITFNIDKF